MSIPIRHPHDSDITSIMLLLQEKKKKHILTFAFADFVDNEND